MGSIGVGTVGGIVLIEFVKGVWSGMGWSGDKGREGGGGGLEA